MTVTSCNDCNSVPTPCHTSVDVAELLYVSGLDSSLCEKFKLLADIVQLRDCAGNLISTTTPIVTCADFRTQLCNTMALFTSSGPITLGVTELVAPDCTTYTVPETPVSRVNSPSVNLSLTGAFDHTIRADVIISPTAGNSLVQNPNGLFVPGASSICTQLAGIGSGAPSVPNVSTFIGPDCLTHVQTETPLTVTDTTSIDFTISGTSGHDLTGVVKVDPAFTNLLQIGVNGLIVPCSSIQSCYNLCAAIAALPLAGVGVPGTTQFVGADCGIYTLPPIANLSGELCAPDSPSLFGLVLGSDALGNVEWQNPTRTDLQVGASTLNQINDATNRDSVFWLTGNIVLPVPTDSCSRYDIYLKNISGIAVTVSSPVALIDGQATITLEGTVVGGYPFGNDGGESAHLYYDFSAATWRVL